ncbi:hypothetical protein C8R46DRAFT_1216974 [Mycena filopes]|nr:hypothetical protein C8R46DRAFT_1216974 [Mycena filopes]
MFPSSSTPDLPTFTISTPDLTDIELDRGTTSAFPTPYTTHTPLLRARSHEPLAVAACPIPTTRSAKAFLSSPVRKFMGRLRGATAERQRKTSSTAHHRSLTSPRSPMDFGIAFAPARRATLGGRPAARRPLTICDPGFFTARRAVNGDVGDDDDSDENANDDGGDGDGEGELGELNFDECALTTPTSTFRLSRAPPPTPADPSFRAPPPTPVRGAVFVGGGGTNSSVWQRLMESPGSRRREQKKLKILKTVGPASETACVAERITGIKV